MFALYLSLAQRFHRHGNSLRRRIVLPLTLLTSLVKSCSRLLILTNVSLILSQCCDRTQIGLSPVLQEALGCCSGKHVTPQQLQKDPSLRPASALAGVSH